MGSPHIITITDLRRRTSGVIEGPVAADVPVFVTHRGYVAAVMLSQTLFDRLAKMEPNGVSGSREASGSATALAKAGIESFGPLPRGTLFETPWNLVDAETAAFLMEEGVPVRPYRREWTEAGPLVEVAGDGNGS